MNEAGAAGTGAAGLGDGMDKSGVFEMGPIRREGRGFQRQPTPRLKPAVHEMIGRRLKLHYEELQHQPLPDRLAELMRALERTEEEPAPPRRN